MLIAVFITEMVILYKYVFIIIIIIIIIIFFFFFGQRCKWCLREMLQSAKNKQRTCCKYLQDPLSCERSNQLQINIQVTEITANLI